MFLGDLKRAHHLRGVLFEKFSAICVKLPVTYKKRFKTRLAASTQRQKSEESAGSTSRVAAGKLLGDSLGDAKDISRMFINVAHQRFAAELPSPLGIIQALGDL